ncbi:MAG: S26 family signal peptidase, partial [Roseburia faecis]|nr:S26 family signal peptidase [Roseburia faecis]
RVIALPGDTIDIHDGRVYVNGEEESSPYAVGSTEPETITDYPITLEDGMYFLLGAGFGS